MFDLWVNYVFKSYIQLCIFPPELFQHSQRCQSKMQKYRIMKYTSSELWKKGSRATQGSVEAPRVCSGWELNLKMGMVQERGFTVGRRKAATGPPIYAWNTFVLNCGSLYPRSNHSHLLLRWEYWFQLVCLSDMQLRSKDSKADLSMIYPCSVTLKPVNTVRC